MNNIVTFDKKKKQQLRKAYNKMIKNGETCFDFEGHQYYGKYAMYLLEHLDNVIK